MSKNKHTTDEDKNTLADYDTLDEYYSNCQIQNTEHDGTQNRHENY